MPTHGFCFRMHRPLTRSAYPCLSNLRNALQPPYSSNSSSTGRSNDTADAAKGSYRRRARFVVNSISDVLDKALDFGIRIWQGVVQSCVQNCERGLIGNCGIQCVKEKAICV